MSGRVSDNSRVSEKVSARCCEFSRKTEGDLKDHGKTEEDWGGDRGRGGKGYDVALELGLVITKIQKMSPTGVLPRVSPECPWPPRVSNKCPNKCTAKFWMFSIIFRSVQKVFKKYQNCLWVGPKALPETSLIRFDHVLAGHLFGHFFDTLGGQGHSRDTLGETPRILV